MADLIVVEADVVKDTGSGADVDKSHDAGEALNVLQAVYLKDVTIGTKTVQRWFKSRALGTAGAGTIDEARTTGVTLSKALSAGQPVQVGKTGVVVNCGAILSAGELYVTSSNFGGIAPIGDLIVGNYTTIVGWAKSTSLLELFIQASDQVRTTAVT